MIAVQHHQSYEMREVLSQSYQEMALKIKKLSHSDIHLEASA